MTPIIEHLSPEGFVTGWVLDDVELKIDKRQFGNVKGVSTAHYLVSLVHYLHQSQCGKGGPYGFFQGVWFSWPHHSHWENDPYGNP